MRRIYPADEYFELALKSKNLRMKVEYLSKYLESNPNDRDLWEYKGELLSDLGRDREALACFKASANLEDEPSYAVGVAKLELGDYEEAIKLLDDVIKKKPDYGRAWFEKGRALARLERWSEAIACFNKALEIGLSKVKESRALCEKAWALVGKGNYEEALQCLECSLEIDPGFAKAWCLKGTILIQDDVKRYEDALACFDTTLEILRENPTCKWAELAKEFRKYAEQKLKEP